MKKVLILLFGLVVWLGCARVRVEAPEKPIKMDISMRLDIYQHVEKDIDQIENIVSGSAGESGSASKNDQSFLGLVRCAYAQEGLGKEVESAALRRKERLARLTTLEASGMIGENSRGMVEVRDGRNAGVETNDVVNGENADRAIIYKEVARKNGTSVGEVEAIYAKRLQNDAPSGTPIETANGWVVK